MRVKKEIICILLMAIAMLLSACSSDNTEAQVVTTGEKPSVARQVQVIAYAPQYTEKVSSSRAAPDGFSAYTPDKVTDMGMYMLKADDVTPYTEKLLKYATKWFAHFDVDANTHYTVYGYMPKAEGMTSLLSVTSGGATLTINNIQAVSADDICIITGVKETDTGLKEGQFHWFMANANDDFYMYLLLDHLYASVNFSLKVHANFAQLRTIRLKTMKLSVNKASVNATVKLTHNTDGLSPIADEEDGVTYEVSGSSCDAEIFNNTEGQALSSTTPVDISACFAPSLSANLTLFSTYDVYDSKDNLIRANCTATNKIPALNAKRGERIHINMTVNPTYLYVLSDQDLDNLFTIEE